MESVEAGRDEVKVMNWEYFVIAMAYIAECFMYKQPVDFSHLTVAKQRDKIVDTFLQLLKLE